MRRYGVANAYERLKELTRGRDTDEATVHRFIDSLIELPEADRVRLRELSPLSYTGIAAKLARDI